MYILRNIQHYFDNFTCRNSKYFPHLTARLLIFWTEYVIYMWSISVQKNWLRPVSLTKLKCEYICLCNVSNKIERESLVSCRGWESPPADKHGELPRAGVSSSIPTWASSAEQQLLQCPEVLTQVCELERGSREPRVRNRGDLLPGVGISVLI